MMHKLTYDEIQHRRLSEAEAATTEKRMPVIAILENIRSLYNVGSIFRTSDGARLEAVYTVGYTPHPPRPEIEKTALGATRTVPSSHFETIKQAIAEIRTPIGRMEFGSSTRVEGARVEGAIPGTPPRPYKIAALEISSESRSVFSLHSLDFPLALIIGNEITGVSDEAIALCDFTLEIPMLGAKHSLNVAVAFGIAAFECVRCMDIV